MLSKPIPFWILAGGAVLASVAGWINAVGFVGVHHQALSHMSGSAAIFSTELALGQVAFAERALAVLGFFFLGCVVSGMIIRQSTLQLGPRYGVALACESGLLFAAAYFLRHDNNLGDYLAAMACGLQNALATTYSGAVIRTTHITGMVTDLGISAGLVLRREPIDRRRTGLHLLLVGGFILGGFLGAVTYQSLGFDALFFPAAVTGAIAVGYTAYRRLRRATT